MTKNVLWSVSLLCLLILSCDRSGGRPLAGYHIGNSLTWDAKPGSMEGVFAAANYDLAQGYHIACGQSLTSMTQTPENTCVKPPKPYSTWDHALANHDWDFITIQAYPGTNGVSEIEAANLMISTATRGGRNSNCLFYLYFAWPKQSETMTYSEQIDLAYTNVMDPVILSSAFMDVWFEAVSKTHPDLDIRLVPTGKVFQELDRRLKKNPVGDFGSAYDLYRDVHHMTKDNGRYVAHATMLAALLKTKPDALGFSKWSMRGIHPEFRRLANEVIWEVLTKDPRTEVAGLKY